MLFCACFMEGIEAAPVSENNMFEIRAKILGPRETTWEGDKY